MYHDLVHLCSACKLYAPLTEVQWYSTLNMIKCVTENLRFLHETVRKLVLVFIFTDFHCQAWEWGESSDRPKWVGSWRSGQVHWRHRHAQWQVWVVGYCGEMCQSDAGTSVSLSLCHLVCMFVKYCLCTIGSVKTVRYTEWQGAHYSGVAWVLKWMEGQLGKCVIEEKSPLGGVPL